MSCRPEAPDMAQRRYKENSASNTGTTGYKVAANGALSFRVADSP